MRKFLREIKLGAFFLVISAVFSGIHYLIFRDAAMIFSWMLASLAFLPIQVYLVGVVLDRLLAGREKDERIRKMNMIVGAFFSEVGTDLLQKMAELDQSAPKVKTTLALQVGSNRDFSKLAKQLTGYKPSLDINSCDFTEMKILLTEKSPVLLRMLENPILLEHETFADLLWAVVHLYQELKCRPDLHRLSEVDRKHIEGDFHRAYTLLLSEWLVYLGHLQKDYPYLFSLAVRLNPYDLEATAEIKGL